MVVLVAATNAYKVLVVSKGRLMKKTRKGKGRDGRKKLL